MINLAYLAKLWTDERFSLMFSVIFYGLVLLGRLHMKRYKVDWMIKKKIKVANLILLVNKN